MSPANSADEVDVRKAQPGDASVCGEICYSAFSAINQNHGFPCDFPGSEVPTQVLSWMFSHPGFYCVVAEIGGRIVGSSCLDERSSIAGVGPVTIDPQAQNRGVGRMLMQAAFHNRSLSLYTSLGFDVREPLSCVQGRTLQRSVPGCTVRPARPEDLSACNAVSQQVHGFHRGGELADALKQGTALIVERSQRITGYASSLSFFGHAAAETNLDLQALIASADSFAGSGILVPARNSALLRWCLANGLRVVQPMTLMSLGLYNEPSGAWLPSVSF